MQIVRRTLLAASLTAAAPRAAWANQLSRGVFSHGVASGDPLPDGVMLWTRFVGGDGRIAWEIAEDDAFARIVQRGEAAASVTNDFCVKVDVRGLTSGRRYFYRFLSASGPSLTGQTRTAPAASAATLTVALFSCANFPFGYFHAYGHAAARDDIDLVLHAGDYIYEMPRGAYPSAADAVPGRIIDPAGAARTLSDYYLRYATYHTDPDLLELRRLKPISMVWDDHEFADNTWRGGAGSHRDETQGPFADRVAAATKAYFDWMPIRRPDANGVRIYRSLDWGDLARIVMLDSRLIGRDRQLDMRQLGDTAARMALDDQSRTLLGPAQENWFADTLAQSKQRGQPWQIVLQQVVMGAQNVPTEAARLLSSTASSNSRQALAEAARLSALGLPSNTDMWSGYPAARARFLDACAANANNTVVLGGDSHNCWLHNLAAGNGARLAAIEFAGGSISSPGQERSWSNAAPGARESMMRAANPHLAWCDVSHRGYGALHFTRAACEAEWVAFEDVRSPQATPPTVTRIRSSASTSAGPGPWITAY